MAVPNRHVELVYLVTHGPAQTASFQAHNRPPRHSAFTNTFLVGMTDTRRIEERSDTALCFRSVEPGWSHLEPGFCDLAVLDLVDGNHVHLAGTVREGARDRLLIDHHVGDGDPLDKRAVQVRFLEAGNVALTDLRCSAGEQARGKLLVLAVVSPPLHER